MGSHLQRDIGKWKKYDKTLASRLVGEVGDEPDNKYEIEGLVRVVSWNLKGSKNMNPELKQDSTLGIIQPWQKTYEFPTTYREEVTILEGIIDVVNKNGELIKRYRPLDTIVAEAGAILRLRTVSRQVVYVCEYK